jgi:predicted Zn-dependent protease
VVRNPFAMLLASVLCCAFLNPAMAADNPKFMFAKLKTRAQIAKASLVIDKVLPSEALAFSASNGATGCTVYLDTDLVRALPSDALAIVMSHELAHCSLGHHELIRKAVDAELVHALWEAEYEADAYGLQVAKRAGFNSREAFTELMRYFPADGVRHPTGHARVRAITEGVREYPQPPAAGAVIAQKVKR